MDRHIKEILGQYLSESKVSKGYISKKIEVIWNEKMGSAVSAKTKSINYDQGILKISISSSVLKYELLQNVENIKNIVNQELNENLVDSVVLI